MLDKIFVVLVLYKTSLEESKTVTSLSEVLDFPLNLLVYDNSPIRQYEEEYFLYDKFNVHYYHDKLNLGLSTAYNFALALAITANKPWLLLLDQDTTFNRQYILEISALKIETISDNIAAIMPKVISSDNQHMISPSKMLLGGVCRPNDACGLIINRPISGINSGSILNTYYIKSIGGFSLKYSLDMLDHWYFREIIQSGKSVYVMKSKIFQDLSIMGTFEDSVSYNRYKQMLQAEYSFNRENGILDSIVFRLRLCFRLFKQFKYINNQYSKLTKEYILNPSQAYFREGA